MPLACVVFGAWIVLAIFSSRCLYADGAHEFIRVLQAQDFVSLIWSRRFTFYIHEFLLVLAIKLGVTNMSFLRFAFGLGCFLPWPVVLLCCHWISPKHFWVAIMGCAAGYLNACYMAIGEHILAHAFYWSSLFVIVFARPLKPLAALILLTSAVCLLFSYESQLFLCLLLAVLSLWRIVEEARERSSLNYWSRIVLLVAAGLFLASSGIGFYAVIKPKNPAEFMGFKAHVEALLFQKGWTLTWTILWSCLMLSVWLSEKASNIITHRIGILIIFCALVVWGTWPLLLPEGLNAEKQFHNRILNLLVPLSMLPVVLILKYHPEWIESKASRLGQMAAILLLVQSVWQISATWQWHRDVGRLQAVLSSSEGIVPLHASILGTSSIESRTMDFDWTWPCLSIALNPDRQIRSLVCSEFYVSPQYRGMFWQPFDPLKTETLPDLKHYGIEFTNYIAALRSQDVK